MPEQCPLHQQDCIEKKCAWWEEISGVCAVKAIAFWLSCMDSDMTDKPDKK